MRRMLPHINPLLNIVKSLERFHTRRFFYDWRTRSDSIFAPSTTINPDKGSPLAVIRVSGPATPTILQDLTGLKPIRPDHQLQRANSTIKPRYATLSNILDPKNGDLIDMGLVLWFPQPQSYTGQDVCEFHVHGSKAIMDRLMIVLGSYDRTRPAEPGEFTRRAIAHGKLDLMQAEGLSDLIASQTDSQRKLALQGLTRSTRSRYDEWISELVRILAHLEASIDFGEDELIGEQRVVSECTEQLGVLTKKISDFLTVSDRCRSLAKSGANVVILGRPNAGKSTFMNILCRQEKSIVSKMCGTTRDLVEHSFELGGHKLTLCDTAGLKDLDSSRDESIQNRTGISIEPSHNDIEREGINRALVAAEKADLIIYLVDVRHISGSNYSVITNDLLRVLNEVDSDSKCPSIHLVVNKIDLVRDINLEATRQELLTALKSCLTSPMDISVSSISCKTHDNIDCLIDSLTMSLDRLHQTDKRSDFTAMEYVNERHMSLLGSTLRHLEKAKMLDISRIDEMAQHVRESVDYLSRIVGSVANDQVIDIIFKDFCIGK